MSFNYKRRRRHDDQNVDDWLMTYADLITLLLCFFAIFLSVSVPKKEQFDQAREKVMEEFSEKDIVPNASTDVLNGKFPPKPKSGMTANKLEGYDAPFDGMPAIVGLEDGGKFNAVDEPKEGDFKEPPGAETAEDAPDNPAESNTGPEDGDRITTMDMNAAQFFASGSADLSLEGKTILNDLLQVFNSEQYKAYQITVEGHTDDNPINTLQFPSNWELSATRATAVVRYLLEQGIPAQRLRAAGYADGFPKVPNRDEAGRPIPENQAQNRRVVIKLERIDVRR